MSYHIVSIDSPSCSLSCRKGQLTCRDEEGERRLPMEDIASIVVTSFSATIHSKLLLEAARRGIGLVVCEEFKPVSLVLPANRATDTLLTRAQGRLPAQLRRRLWLKTLDAKCLNQFHLASAFAPESPRLEAFEARARSRAAGKESDCARIFWALFGEHVVRSPDFRRSRNGPPPNNLLNFGYAVLLSAVLQKLFAIGIDPTFGLTHAVREHAAPLAYDLMEPFRPAIDLAVVQWMRRHPAPEDWEITPEFRKHAASALSSPAEWQHGEQPLGYAIEQSMRSFRKAILSAQSGPYIPWTQTTTKWAGFL